MNEMKVTFRNEELAIIWDAISAVLEDMDKKRLKVLISEDGPDVTKTWRKTADRCIAEIAKATGGQKALVDMVIKAEEEREGHIDA